MLRSLNVETDSGRRREGQRDSSTHGYPAPSVSERQSGRCPALGHRHHHEGGRASHGHKTGQVLATEATRDIAHSVAVEFDRSGDRLTDPAGSSAETSRNQPCRVSAVPGRIRVRHGTILAERRDLPWIRSMDRLDSSVRRSGLDDTSGYSQHKPSAGFARPRRADVLPISLPPRGINRVEAAAYVGVSTTKFDEMVADGRMPIPKRIDGRVVWDRKKLDAAFDQLPDAEARGGEDDEWKAAV